MTTYNKKCNHCSTEFETEYETKLYCSKSCIKKANTKRSWERALKQYAPTMECYGIVESLVEEASPSAKTFLNGRLVEYGFEKVKGRWCIRRTKIEEFKERFKKEYDELIAKKEIEKSEKPDKIIRKSKEQLTWEYKELQLYMKNYEKLLAIEKKQGIQSEKFKSMVRSLNRRMAYLDKYWETGVIAHKKCTTCEEIKPFYEYYSDIRAGKSGLAATCAACYRKSAAERFCPAKAKEARIANYVSTLQTTVAISIKQSISENNKKYKATIGTGIIWRKIEEHCKYTANDLAEHLEKQFSDKMHWGNRTTPRNPGDFGWHLDHIIPHSNFKYDDLDHPDFAKCWALENLRPMAARMNMARGNKNLYNTHRASFRQGMLSSVLTTKGIWQYLPYTNLQAREHIESLFSAGMEWQNHGDVWEIDHIDPLAHLAYTCESNENFKKVWDIANIQPLLISANRSKSSIYMDEKWIHNYEKAPGDQNLATD